MRFISLVEGLRRSGVDVSVLTPRHGTEWPDLIQHREINIYRPFEVPRGFWSISRYLRAATRWIQDRAKDFDLIYVDGIREEASAVVTAGIETMLPTVLRFSGSGIQTDAAWWRDSRGGLSYLRQSLNADAFIAPRPSAVQQLITAGVSSEKIARIDDGIPPFPRISENDRRASRSALFSVNREFRLEPDSRVILSSARLTRSSGVWQALQAASQMLNRWSSNRVWIVGEGPERDRLIEEVRQCGLVGDILVPGSFDHYDELVSSADVALVSADAECLDYFLPMVIARGIPVLAAQSVDVRAFLGAEAEFVTWYRAEDGYDLSQQLVKLLANYEDALRKSETLRTRLISRKPSQTTVDMYQRLFARCVALRKTSSQLETPP